MLVEVFDRIGVRQWLRLATRLVGVAGAVALPVPGNAAFGALRLAGTMVGAVLTLLLVLPTSSAPAAGLPVLSAALAWLR